MNIFQIIFLEPLANGLVVFYKLLGNNLGLAIIGFSIFLRFVLNPLTKPYMESMKKMKDLSPFLDKLKKKYKNDRMGLAKAQSDLYKEKGVNPGAGCLPYLLQIVILIAFFNMFSKVITPGTNIAENFNSYLYEPLKFSQDVNINTKFLYFDITKPDAFRLGNVPFPIPGPLVVLAALVQLLSSKMMAPVTKIEKKLADKTESQTDDFQTSMQQSMTYTFPVFTLIIGVSFPSGLALYWLLFSLWQLIQQYQSYGLGGLKPWFLRLGLIKS